jgi:hypothetical protein
MYICMNGLFIYLFPVAPTCSIGHPWNTSFYFSYLILDSRYDSLDGGSARSKVATYTGQHKHRINVDIHSLSGIRTHDPSLRAGEDIWCLRPRGHCDRPWMDYVYVNRPICKWVYIYAYIHDFSLCLCLIWWSNSSRLLLLGHNWWAEHKKK